MGEGGKRGVERGLEREGLGRGVCLGGCLTVGTWWRGLQTCGARRCWRGEQSRVWALSSRVGQEASRCRCCGVDPHTCH